MIPLVLNASPNNRIFLVGRIGLRDIIETN